MALVEEDAVDDAFDGLIDGRVFEHDVRGLATEFERELLLRARDRSGDGLADLGAAGEGNLVYVGMLHERRAGFAGAGDDVHHARRQVCFLKNLRQTQRGEAGRLGGLEHDGVSASKRGRELPRRHQQREIPRNDLCRHAQRSRGATGEGIL